MTSRPGTEKTFFAGQFVWEYSQGACPATLVSLYREPTKVFTNSLTTFTGPSYCVPKGNEGYNVPVCVSSQKDSPQSEHCCGADRGGIREVQFGGHQSGVHQSGVWAELLGGNYEVAGDTSAGDGWDMRGSQADLSDEAGKHCGCGKSGKCGLCDQVPTSGGYSKDLHQWDDDRNDNDRIVFVDPISFVIKPAAAPVRCNDIAPPRWRLNGCWHCTFLQIPDCSEPGRIPIKLIAIDDVNVTGLCFGGEHIQPPMQLVEFACCQESQPRDAASLLGRDHRAVQRWTAATHSKGG